MLDFSRYKVVSPVIWKQKTGLLQLLGLAILAACITALMPWPIKLLVDYALADNPLKAAGPFADILSTPSAFIIAAAIASISLYLLSSTLSVASSWLWSKVGQKMVFDLSLDMFERLQRLSRLYHTKHPVADSLGRLTVDSWCVFTIAQSLLITPAQNVVTLLIISVFAWQIDPYLALLSLAITPVLAITTVVFGERLRARAQRNREAQSAVMSFTHQTINSVPLAQAFNTEETNCRKFNALSGHAVRSAQKNYLLDNGFTVVNAISLSAGLAFVLIAGGQRVLDGTITVGSLLVFLGYLQTLQGETESLLLTFKNLKSSEANLDRVLEIMEADEEVVDSNSARRFNKDPDNQAPGVTFENVCFSYQPGTPVLKNINLKINPGETVAFVGGSGSGKSTLASLVPRFFNWDSGNIYVGDQNILDIELVSLRELISVVLQEPFLQPISIADNIAYGTPKAPRVQIIKAATIASAAAFIKKLPNGYDTILGERGSNLSGGQKQRLAIARAILKNAPLLILDEPTSALDARTETLFFEAMSKLMQGKTTIIVAHRLSTIRDADKIVVIEKGEIAEVGNHAELIALNGIYAHMISLQSEDNTVQEAA